MKNLRPNRYGGACHYRNGEQCCRHLIPLSKPCERCAELLAVNRDKSSDRELPTLSGVGVMIDFDEGR